MNLELGTKATYSTIVDSNNTAKAMGSGSLEVFATPSMVAIMEKASTIALEPYLESGSTTVGTNMNVAHTSATPVGIKVTAEATVTNVNGREITFDVKAFDEVGLIGEGTHKRFIVYAEKFQSKANAKLK